MMQILTMSKKSSAKYKNTSHYEDLVSEGAMAAYEELEVNPQAGPARIYQVINWAQWKFLNVDSLPVYMPENLVRMVKGMGSDDVETNYTEESIEWAKVLLAQGQFRSEYHDTDHTSNQEEELSKEDLLEKIWEAASECLSDEEYDWFFAHFSMGVSQTELAKQDNVSDRWVRYKFASMQSKVHKHVINKKWEL